MSCLSSSIKLYLQKCHQAKLKKKFENCKSLRGNKFVDERGAKKMSVN